MREKTLSEFFISNAHLPLVKAVCSAGVISMIAGCASQDLSFQDTAVLELGKTSETESEAIFGEPGEVTIHDNRDGSFKHVVYGYVIVRPFSLTDLNEARTLCLEFRDGRLNAYSYKNTVLQRSEIEALSFDSDRYREIHVGSTTKAEVVEMIGRPHAMAKCPTFDDCFGDHCSNAAEVWMWNMLFQLDTRRLVVLFDSDGVVSDLDYTGPPLAPKRKD